MTAELIQTGAPSTCSNTQWQSIDWQKVEKHVRRLQMRIAKAIREGKHSKAKSLQWTLTHSIYAKLFAVKRVTQNRGSRTAGIDNVTVNEADDKMQLALSLNRRGYKASPLKRIYIPKSNGKRRPLGIPTMKDRAMQALHLLALEPISETRADKHSYGFRTMRSTADAVGQCHIVLSRKVSAQWVLEGDIKGCFDNINHQWLMENIPMDKTILHKWLKAGYMEKQCLFPTEEGTPQGGIISPTLANMTLDGLENAVADCTTKIDKAHVIRYADDFIITASTEQVLVDKIKPAVEDFLRDRGLSLSEEKTKITHITVGFDFLGLNIRKYGKGKLLTKPSKKSVKTFLDGIREIVKNSAALKTEELIRILNPKIRGWVYYYRFASSKKTFSYVHFCIMKALLRWIKRRHPNMSATWRKDRYFLCRGLQQWVFGTNVFKKRTGKVVFLELFNANSVPIKRHIKIRAAVTPFDPDFKEYIEKRKLKYRRKSSRVKRKWDNKTLLMEKRFW